MSVLPEIQPGNPPANLEDYTYISSQSNDSLGIFINVGGVPTDPDGNTVLVSFVPDQAGSTPVFANRDASRYATGQYYYTFLSTDTQQAGFYHLSFTYAINGVPDTFLKPVEVGPYNPAYDQLVPEAKFIVDLVWDMFADGYDSQFGGPNLQSYFQSHFSRGRLAQLLYARLLTINVEAQPVNRWSLNAPNYQNSFANAPIPGSYPPGTTPPALPPGTSPPWPPYGTPDEGNTPDQLPPPVSYSQGPAFPYSEWSGLLIQGLKIEVIKHLMRSYVEEPQADGVTSARMNRRDYMQRWGEILKSEEKEYKSILDTFKVRQMFALNPKVLVAGGVYGNWAGPTRLAGSAAARPRYYARFY